MLYSKGVKWKAFQAFFLALCVAVMDIPIALAQSPMGREPGTSMVPAIDPVKSAERKTKAERIKTEKKSFPKDSLSEDAPLSAPAEESAAESGAETTTVEESKIEDSPEPDFASETPLTEEAESQTVSAAELESENPQAGFSAMAVSTEDAQLMALAAEEPFMALNAEGDPVFSPDPDSPNITQLPRAANGSRVNLTGFASQDGTVQNLTVFSPTFASFRVEHQRDSSFSGVFAQYDQPINLDALYPDGLVLGLDSAEIGMVKLEVTDAQGNRSAVYLDDIEAFGQRWRVNTDAFTGVDTANISTIALVIEGDIAGNLNIDWGEFAHTPALPPDTANPDVTMLPVTSTGSRAGINGFASEDGSSQTVTQFSPTFTQLAVNNVNDTSFSGAYVAYDNPQTAGVESVDLGALYPEGMVLGLDSPAGALDRVKLEVTDAAGNRGFVHLTGIEEFGQRWKVLPEQFFGVDVSKITTLALVVEGQANGTLSIDWGVFSFSGQIPPDEANPAVTPLPRMTNGARTNLTGFASQDGTTQNLTQFSPTFARLSVDHADAGSFSGAFAAYDDPQTAAVETVDLTQAFPNGMVLGLDSPEGAIDRVKLEVTDVDGRRGFVYLTGITEIGQTWKIMPADQFFEVDVTKISTLALVLEGDVQGDLSIDWGEFAYVPQLQPDAANPGVTLMPALVNGDRASLNGFASADGAAQELTKFSPTFSRLSVSNPNDTSYSGTFVAYDDPQTGAVESIDMNALFADGLVLGMDSPEGAIERVKFEVTDADGKKSFVYLDGITAVGQKWKILPEQFFGVDASRITTFAIVVEGQENGELSLDWGEFSFTPDLPPDEANPTVTMMPALASGDRAGITAFASGDGSTAALQQFSPTFSRLAVDNATETSFSGTFVAYDNPQTAAVEAVDLNTAFPDGLVLGMDSPAGAINRVKLEVTDAGGKKNHVYLNGITEVGQKWKILPEQFFGVDTANITTFAVVIEGAENGELSLDWGEFAYTPELPPDTSNPDITLIPALNSGARAPLRGFASEDGSTQTLQQFSTTFAQLTVDNAGPASFSGVYIPYDNPSTSRKETINLETAFPNGIVFGLDSPEGAVDRVKFEVTDINNRKSFVYLNGIEAFGQRWKTLASQFVGVDVTAIQTMAIVIEGEAQGTLSIDWGHFART